MDISCTKGKCFEINKQRTGFSTLFKEDNIVDQIEKDMVYSMFKKSS